MAATISNKPVSDFDAAVRLLSGGTNIAIYNDLGLPSIFVRRDKGTIADVIEGGSQNVHPAFRVNGVEIPAFYMGKYLATVYKGRALSLPLQDPAASSVAAADRGDAASSYVNFDNAKTWCEANGEGFHLPTIAEYAWLALLSRKNGTMPHGNTNYGKDGSFVYEKGVGSYFDGEGRACRTLTGSGPAKWNDNWQPDGICDLTGDVYEWQGGYRTVDGELQIFADNNAAMQWEQNPTSTFWKAILQDGSLVEPGTNGSLKWDYTADPGTASASKSFRLNTTIQFPQTVEAPYGSMSFAALTAAENVNVPELLKALALMPADSGSHGGDYMYMRNLGERLVYRGGRWDYGGSAGVFFAAGNGPRSYSGTSIGFRPAFIPGI